MSVKNFYALNKKEKQLYLSMLESIQNNENSSMSDATANNYIANTVAASVANGAAMRYKKWSFGEYLSIINSGYKSYQIDMLNSKEKLLELLTDLKISENSNPHILNDYTSESLDFSNVNDNLLHFDVMSYVLSSAEGLKNKFNFEHFNIQMKQVKIALRNKTVLSSSSHDFFVKVLDGMEFISSVHMDGKSKEKISKKDALTFSSILTDSVTYMMANGGKINFSNQKDKIVLDCGGQSETESMPDKDGVFKSIIDLQSKFSGAISYVNKENVDLYKKEFLNEKEEMTVNFNGVNHVINSRNVFSLDREKTMFSAIAENENESKLSHVEYIKNRRSVADNLGEWADESVERCITREASLFDYTNYKTQSNKLCSFVEDKSYAGSEVFEAASKVYDKICKIEGRVAFERE